MEIGSRNHQKHTDSYDGSAFDNKYAIGMRYWYECSDSDPEVLFLSRQSPDPKHRIEMGDPIHAIPKVDRRNCDVNECDFWCFYRR